MKFCIIGAGPTGLGAAHRLAELGVTDFRVFDQNPYVGGLATSITDGKGFTWDVAVHVTHSHYHYFDRVLENALPGGYYTLERRSWVRLYDRFLPYPFQYNIRHLPPEALWDCVEGLLDPARGKNGVKPVDFHEWVEAGFGRGIAKHFMLPYNRKLWTVPATEMAYQWIGDRVPQVDTTRVLRNVILQRDDVTWGPNFSFQFPKTGGTGAIWNAVAAALPAGTVQLNQTVVGIDPRAKTIRLANGAVERYEHLISTLPVPLVARLAGLDAVATRASQLRHSHVYVMCVAPAYPIPDALREKTWVYCPGPESNFYRLTPFSIFSPAHTPDNSRFCSFLCEISVPAGETRSPEELRRATFEGLVRGGYLPHVPEDTHTHLFDATYGYPIPTPERDRILGDVLPALESHHIYSRGRFGGWKYEAANMDHTFMQGVEVVDRILKGTPEKTLPTPDVVNAGKH
ncbi:MAG: NAD(P)-binding protein [Lentisphaerae bacterium]|nr:NAD(P)-binding protein [Lentisphaerota bacterium]